MLTFIHFSDTHLGFNEFDADDEHGINIREQDVCNAFSKCIDIILEQRPEFVLHTGDLFHRSVPTNRILIFAQQQLQRLTAAGIPLYIIAGNHDYPKTIYTTPIFPLYENNLTKIAYRQELEIIEKENYVLHLLPHINDNEKFNEEVKKIGNLTEGKPNILSMHLSYDSGYAMNEIGEGVFPAELKENLYGYNYVALGHWHRYRRMGNKGYIYYAGSTERTSEDQSKHPLGIVKVTVTNSGTETEFIEIPLRTYKVIEVDCKDKTVESIRKEIEVAAGTDTKGGIYRVSLINITAEQKILLTKQEIEINFPGALQFGLSYKSETGVAETTESGESGSLLGLFDSYINDADGFTKDEQKSIIEFIRQIWTETEEKENETK